MASSGPARRLVVRRARARMPAKVDRVIDTSSRCQQIIQNNYVQPGDAPETTVVRDEKRTTSLLGSSGVDGVGRFQAGGRPQLRSIAQDRLRNRQEPHFCAQQSPLIILHQGRITSPEWYDKAFQQA